MYDIIVVGAGTAGLSAAIYAVRAGKSVLVLEGKNYGGQIINTPSIENYPGIKNVSGFEFATNLYEQAVELGVKIEYNKVISIEDKGNVKCVVIDKILEEILKKNVDAEKINHNNIGMGKEDNKKLMVAELQFDLSKMYKAYECKSVIIATGTINRKLGLAREDALIGKGISYCATCDGAFYRGKDVAIVGGGNTALEDALFLSNYCSKVYVVHRRDSFRGEDALVKNLEDKDNVKFVLDSNVISLNGNEKIESIDVKNNKTGEDTSLEVSGLFVAIGQVPSNEQFRGIVDLDSYGYIVAGEDCKTTMDGVYVAGDCRTKKVRQLTTAASDGAIAGLAACEYIDLLVDK